jgi:hypothetical protein
MSKRDISMISLGNSAVYITVTSMFHSRQREQQAHRLQTKL